MQNRIIGEVIPGSALAGSAKDGMVAVKLLSPEWRRPHNGASKLAHTNAPPPLAQPMNREFEARFTAILLGLFTVAAVLFAGFNYKNEHQSAIPDDGAWWMERNGHLVADRLGAERSGRAGWRPPRRRRGQHQRPSG